MLGNMKRKKNHTSLLLDQVSLDCDYRYEQRLCIHKFSKEYLKKVLIWDSDFEKLLMVFEMSKFL